MGQLTSTAGYTAPPTTAPPTTAAPTIAAPTTAAGGLAGLAGPIGLGTQIVGIGFSIAQAIDARKKARDAERAGNKLLEQAKTRIDVNRMEGVQVPLEAYQMAARETTAQTKQALEGLREADARTLASGVAKLSEASGAVTEQQRQDMGQDIYKRDVGIATEQASIDRMMGGISLEEAAGTALRRAEKEEDAQKSLQSAFTGAGQALVTAAQMPQLYSQRQGQLAAAQQYQQQTGMYQGMTPAQARKAMINAGITQQGFQNLAAGLTVAGRQVQQATPSIQSVGIQPLAGGIQPATLPASSPFLPFSINPGYLPGIMGNIPYIK